MKEKEFLSLIETAFKKEALKKLVFSRPENSEVNKISCRLVAHRGRRLLAMEYSLPGNTVSHKNLSEDSLCTELASLIDAYKQVNLITMLGDAEYKRAKAGKEVILGGESLRRKMEGTAPAFDFRKLIFVFFGRFPCSKETSRTT